MPEKLNKHSTNDFISVGQNTKHSMDFSLGKHDGPEITRDSFQMLERKKQISEGRERKGEKIKKRERGRDLPLCRERA
jgi:hypothetical protein